MYFNLDSILSSLVNEPDETVRYVLAHAFRTSPWVQEALKALKELDAEKRRKEKDDLFGDILGLVRERTGHEILSKDVEKTVLRLSGTTEQLGSLFGVEVEVTIAHKPL